MNLKSNKAYHIGLDARFYRSDTGGIGRYSRELVKNLAAIDQFNQYTVFLTEADLPEWDISQENFKAKVISAPHYSLAEQTKFWLTLEKERFDLVHFLNFNHPVLYRRPFITTLHDLTMFFYPAGRSQVSKLRRMAFIRVLKRSLIKAKKVIAISEHSAHDAEKHLNVPHAKMEVIYEGGPDILGRNQSNKAVIQGYLNTKEPYFLFVSQWRPHKGILTLIDAFNRFKAKTGFPHKLVLLGKQKVLQDEVKQVLANSPYTSDILTPGFAPEELLPGLYRHSTACVFPSEYEGFGLPVLEAFACGTPLIVADNSSLPEVAGEAGIYFPTRNAEKLAERMEEVVTTPGFADEMVSKGYSQLKKFSWERMAEKTLDLYLSVLEKHA